MTLNRHNRHICLPPPQYSHGVKPACIGCWRDEVCGAGAVMVAANKKKSSGKLNTEMFDDVPVLQRKWQAALRPGEALPRYEDVMLGSLGRLADHIVLLRQDDETLGVSRSGRYIQQWLNDERWDIPMSA